MRGEDDDFFFGCATQLANYVTGLVDLDFEAGGGEKNFYRSGALRLLKWWGGNFRDVAFLVVDRGHVAREPGECGTDFRVVGELRGGRGATRVRNAGGSDGHGE